MKLKNPHSIFMIVCLLMMIAFSSCDPIIPPPEQSISIEVATRLQDEFIETRAGILNVALGFVDTRDFTFSLDSIKKYIAYVEQQAEMQGVDNSLGLRVHFAAYPPQSNFPTPGKATVFFVPTVMQSSPNEIRGFFPMPVPPDEVLEGVNAFNLGTGGIPPNDL